MVLAGSTRSFLLVVTCALLGCWPTSAQSDARGNAATSQGQSAPSSASSRRKPPATSTVDKPGAAAVGKAEAAAVQRARDALKAGRPGEAIVAIDEVLAKAPASEQATAVKVDALIALDNPKGALATYDAYVSASGRDSAAILSTIARGQVKALTAAPLTNLKVDALETLAERGDADAKAALRALAKDAKTGGWAATSALARLGDREATQQMLQLVSESQGSQRAEALRELGTIKHAPAEAVVRESLKANDPALQATAAEVAATLKLKTLIPDLKQVATNGVAFGQFAAAVALTRLGDASGRDRIAQALASDVPDARLMAGTALRDGPDTTWVARIRPLLDNPDGLNRFFAAELLLPIDRSAAMKVLQPATADPNPTIRTEAARILAQDPKTDLSLLRPLLSDAAPRVRLWGARAILSRTAAPRG